MKSLLGAIADASAMKSIFGPKKSLAFNALHGMCCGAAVKNGWPEALALIERHLT